MSYKRVRQILQDAEFSNDAIESYLIDCADFEKMKNDIEPDSRTYWEYLGLLTEADVLEDYGEYVEGVIIF